MMIVSYYMLGQFTTLPTFFVAFMFVAVGAALFKPVVVGTVAKVTNDSNSATGFGIFYMMVNVGGFVGPIVAGLVRGQGWKWVFVVCSAWAGVNLLIVLTLYREPKVEAGPREGGLQKVLDNMVEVLGNVRFFLSSFNQIFYTMPEYIRDFTETRPMIEFVEGIFGKSDAIDPDVGVASYVATINDVERAEIVNQLSRAVEAGLTTEVLEDTSRGLLQSKVRIAPDALRSMLDGAAGDIEGVTDQIMVRARQVNPEFIVNIDALAIVLFQVLISFLMAKFHRFTTMIVGMVIAAVGIGLSAFAGGAGAIGVGGSLWVVALGLFIFAVGEMMASPTHPPTRRPSTWATTSCRSPWATCSEGSSRVSSTDAWPATCSGPT